MLLISANACVASENEFLYHCKHLYKSVLSKSELILSFSLQTASLNSTLCRISEHLDLTVTVSPVSPVTGHWRFNKTDNWTKGSVECSKEIGEKQLFVLAENGISVSITECLPKIKGKRRRCSSVSYFASLGARAFQFDPLWFQCICFNSPSSAST